MAKGRSCCCSGLSRGWWWFLALAGIPLLYTLMFVTKRGVIEKDLHTRTTQKLNDAGAHWASVDLDGRARDVLLTGTATTEADRDNAIQAVLSVEGVREVNSDIKVVLLKKRALTAKYTHKDGKLVLEGVLSSQQKVDEMLKLVGDKVGLDKIDNKLTISDEFSPKDGVITLSGLVLGEDMRSDITSAIQAGSSALGLNFTNNLEIDVAAAKAIAEEKAKAERLAAEKAEANERKMAADKLAAEKVKAEKAQTLVAEEAETKKLAAEKADAERLMAKKQEAEAKIAAEKVQAKKQAEEKAKVAEKAVQVSVCQTKLNKTMLGKTILFRTNKANIKKSSFSLLQQISNVIGECRVTLPDTRIVVSGHTDSAGSEVYNLALSQRRANAVKTHLVGIGVSSAIITSKGFGESEPVASNDTAEGRAQNRRITFSVK